MDRQVRSLWTSVREAVAGTEQDFTTGPLGRGVLLLAVPMVLEMAGEALFAVCDAFFVARLGPAALAAVGLTEALLEVVYSIAIGLGMATTALVARRYGERRYDDASVAAVQAIGVAFAVALGLGILGLATAPALLGALGAPENAMTTGLAYTRWMLGGQPSILLLFVVNAVFRGAGDASTAMRALWVANGINLVLDPCLIFGLGPFPELGLTGAAVATNVGRTTGVVYGLVCLGRSQRRLGVARAHLRPQLAVARNLLRMSAGGIGQFLVASASWIGLVRILAGFGSEILAGYVLAIRIVVFVILPAWGFSNAAATLVGQNLGASRPDRAERATLLTGLYNMGFMMAVMVLFLLFAHPIAAAFTTEAGVLPTAVQCLRIISYGYGFYAWGMVMVQAFNGAGDTATPTWVNLICFWLFQIPLAWFLSQRIGPSGVFWAIAAAYSLSAVLGMALFRRGRWKLHHV